MRFLLDTHSFLWAVFDPEKLSRPAMRTIMAPDNENRLYYLKWVKKLTERYHLPISEYCLMTKYILILILPHSRDGSKTL